jgi:hypothetical protein
MKHSDFKKYEPVSVSSLKEVISSKMKNKFRMNSFGGVYTITFSIPLSFIF